MSHPITVRDLSGHHLGKRITITTEHTTAEGVLQGFQHQANVVNMTNMARPGWVILGHRQATITLMPNQDIIAELGDVVVVHEQQ